MYRPRIIYEYSKYINVFRTPKYYYSDDRIFWLMIGFLADWFPKQVINDKSLFLTKNWSHVSVGPVTIAMDLNCSLWAYTCLKNSHIQHVDLF